jgi:hypothetical protein
VFKKGIFATIGANQEFFFTTSTINPIIIKRKVIFLNLNIILFFVLYVNLKFKIKNCEFNVNYFNVFQNFWVGFPQSLQHLTFVVVWLLSIIHEQE